MAAMPSPAMCKMLKGPQQLVVDLLDSGTMHPWNAYLRFDLDAAFAGRHLVDVRLRNTATDDNLAPSNTTGRVWKVAPFALADLSVAAPAKVGSSPLAGSQGSVQKLEVMEWSLPTSLVTPSASIYLGLDSTSQH